MRGEQTQLKIKKGSAENIINLPPQAIGQIAWKMNDPDLRRKRTNKLKNNWYHRNKDWSNAKRNETRRERYKNDPEFRKKRLQGKG
jgi:hypothetical protein